MRPLQAALTLANQALAWLAGVLLFMMMLVVSADIGMRLLGRPMAGSYEIIGWLSAEKLGGATGAFVNCKSEPIHHAHLRTSSR